MLVVRAERMFDGERLTRGGVTVTVDEGRILAVEAGRSEPPDGATVLDHPGATLLPGLVDAHVHLCGDSAPGALERLPSYTDADLGELVEASLRSHLAAGVTTVRDLGDRSFLVADARAGRDGMWPTVVASGPPITSAKGHCWNMGGEAGDEEALRRAVRERAEHGVDVVKIMASGGVLTDGTDVLRVQFTLDALRLVVDLAHAAGLPITAHAHGLPAVEQAVAAGVDGIEHCSCLTPEGVVMPDELLATLAERRIVVDPTLGVLPGLAPPPRLLELIERLKLTVEDRYRQAGRMHAAGVVLVTGTDAGIGPAKAHGCAAQAIAELVLGGVAPEPALATATSVAAQALGLGDRKGRLRAGYDADLLLVDGDPVADLTALTHVTAVAVAGTFVERDPAPA